MSNRKQKVKVHRTYSSWQNFFYWVLQGSILRSLLFKICLCDLSSCTDNTTPYNVNLTQELVINKLEEKSSIILKRFKKNYVKLSTQQTFDGLQDVLKRSSRHVLKRSSTRLQRNNFLSSKTSWRCPEDILKTSWKTKNFYAEDALKTSWRHVLKTSGDMSWRRLEDMSWRLPKDMSWKHLQDDLDTKKWGYLYLTNLNVCAYKKSTFHKSISDESKENPKSLIRTQ